MSIDIFVQFEGGKFPIKGESKIKGYEGWIDCQGFTEGMSIPRDHSGSGQATGRATIQEFGINAEVGSHSNFLKKAIATNDHYTKVTIHFVKQQPGEGAGVKAYEIRVLKNVFISSYSTSKGNDMKGMESWSFGSTELTWEYFEQADDGLIGASKGEVEWNTAASV